MSTNPNRMLTYVIIAKLIRCRFVKKHFLNYCRKDGSKDGGPHTPRKMLAKLNSLTIGSFRQSTDEVINCHRPS